MIFLIKKRFRRKYFIKDDILKILNVWDEMIKEFEVGEKISPTILINEVYNGHTDEDFDNYAQWKKDYITKNKPLIEKYRDKFDVWYDKHRDILNKREIYGKLEWQVGPIKENDSIFDYFIQIRQSGIRVKKPHYFPTLVAITQTPIYGKERRYITQENVLDYNHSRKTLYYLKMINQHINNLVIQLMYIMLIQL